MSTVTLHCMIGNHEWERESQRGRRPASCPACLATQEQSKPAPERAVPNVDRLLTEALDILDACPAETQRVVEYIIERLSAPAEQGDVAMHVETLTRIIRRINR